MLYGAYEEIRDETAMKLKKIGHWAKTTGVAVTAEMA